MSVEDHFWSLVNKAGPDDCWLWGGHGERYGQYRRRGAHVWAYELTHGPVPPGLYVCHTCDTPLCCNPAHLWPGTNGQNIADMYAKGRGERRGRKREIDYDQVRTLYAHGLTQDQIAERLGCSQSAVSGIVRRIRA